jgi:hypothetical protein
LGTFSPLIGDMFASLKYFFQAMLYITLFYSF